MFNVLGSMFIPNIRVERAGLLLHTWEVLVLNPGYLDSGFSLTSSVHPDNAETISQIRPQLFPSMSFPIYC
jgi:hypothetical protein